MDIAEDIELTEEIQKLLCISELTNLQKSVIKQRLDKKPYREIKWKDKMLYTRQVSAALKNASLVFPYDIGGSGGDHPYLNDFDLNQLAEDIQDEWQHGHHTDSYGALDMAFESRMERYEIARHFLERINSPDLACEIWASRFRPPTSSWIKKLILKTQLHLRDRRVIKYQRLTACSRAIFIDFFLKFGGYISAVSPLLFFAADETMLETELHTKILVPVDVREAISADLEQFPHISVMCCHSVSGKVLPPFMILPEIQKLPDELKDLAESGLIDIASAPSGYMNRDLFLFWSIIFINEVNEYRKKLSEEVADNKGLLIVDGHSSRGCPIALRLLYLAGFHVIVEPANTSHVIQQFDVGLAHPFKTAFKDKFHRLERADAEGYPSIIARLRRHAAITVISAWESASCLSNRLSAAKATGMYPYNPQVIYDSRFVTNPTPEQFERQEIRDIRRQRGIDISCKMISDPEVIGYIISKLSDNPRFAHLCMSPLQENGQPFKFSDIAAFYLTNLHNNSRMLSTIRPVPPRDTVYIKFLSIR